MGYDDWKAREPDATEGVVGCDACGEELAKCVCPDDDNDVLGLAPEAITDEQVADLVAELREKREIVARVEGVLARCEQHSRQLAAKGQMSVEFELVVMQLRQALGTAI